MIQLNLKKSEQVVGFDGVILCLAVIFSTPARISMWIGVVISLVGMGLCIWAKRYVFTRRKFSVAGPYFFARYPYLLGHFIFVFGLVVQARSFGFLLTSVILLAAVYGLIIRYAEKIPYANSSADYILYRSSVPAMIPQLLAFKPKEVNNEPRKVDFPSILVEDTYAELFRWLSFCVVTATSFVLLVSANNTIVKTAALGLIGSLYGYRFMRVHRKHTKPGK